MRRAAAGCYTTVDWICWRHVPVCVCVCVCVCVRARTRARVLQLLIPPVIERSAHSAAKLSDTRRALCLCTSIKMCVCVFVCVCVCVSLFTVSI